MNTTVFADIDHQIALHDKHLAVLRSTARTARMRRRKYRSRFDMIVLAICGAFFTVYALLFDYVVVLNYTLARLDLWIMLVVTILILARFLHAWIIAPALSERAIMDARRRTARHVATLEGYKVGTIDAQGIRTLYDNTTPTQRAITIDVVAEWGDWIIYTALSLGLVLFGLIFL